MSRPHIAWRHSAFYLCMVALCLLSQDSRAQGEELLRVALLPKLSVSERSQSASALEAGLVSALGARGVRIVDLAQATEAQRLAWSDRVQSGQLPEGLPLLAADALYSAQLECWPTAEKVQGTSLMALQCTLNSKLVRVDSGDVAFSESRSLPAHGLNAASALDALIRTRLPALLADTASRAVERLGASDDWSVDLVVSELADPDLAKRFVPALERLPGVKAARMVLFRAGSVKYLLSGRGSDELAGLSAALSGRAELALGIVYETPRVLAARFDLARALPRPVMVLGLARDSRHAARELRVFRAGLSLLPYLESAHSSPMLGDLGAQTALLEHVKRRAAVLAVPLILELALERHEQRWSASSELLEVSTGHSLIAASGSSNSPEAALSEALQQLDRQYQSGLHSASFQRTLGIAAHVRPAPAEGIVVDAFRLVRQGDRDVANLKLRNVGPASASALTAQIRSQRGLLAALDLGQIAPGSTLEREVALEALPRDSAPGLSVQVDYQIGTERRRAVGQLLSATLAAPTESALEDELPVAYRELTTTAVNYYNAGDWSEARRLFLRVYAAAPNARVARALGLVEWDLRHVEVARKYLTEALESQQRPLSSEQREQVTELLNRIAASTVKSR